MERENEDEKLDLKTQAKIAQIYDAKKMFCPLSKQKCRANECMFWEYDTDEEADWCYIVGFINAVDEIRHIKRREEEEKNDNRL